MSIDDVPPQKGVVMSHCRSDDAMSGVAYNISTEFIDDNVPITLLLYNNISCSNQG